ncbi:MAG: MFS transporter, partial [Clostridia bacterium]|nr:MFS transporter [Clostridia bacterium]
VINVVPNAMIFDCIDYMELKTGYRDNALGSACQSFVNKLGNAFATVIIIAMYVLVHIDPKDVNGVDAAAALTYARSMSTSQNFAMYSLVSIVPGISLLLCAIPIFFYDIVGDKKKKIHEELSVIRAERGIEITE